MHAVYGPQIRATKALACRPEGEAIVGLLARHPAFPEFDMRRSRRLWGAFRDAIYDVLDSADSTRLSTAGIRGASATDLFSAWRKYIAQLELIKELYPCHPQAETVDQIMRLWTGAREQVRANPYCLIPFLPWDNVDRFASVQHDVPQDDSRRLVGACVSAYIHNGRVLTNSISLRELRRRVAHRLGDTSLSDRAIARALECSSLRRDPGAPGNEVQLAGAGILKRALLQSLGVVDSHGKPAPAPRADIIFSEGLPAPLVEESLARQRPSSLHILSAFPRLISFASNCIHIHRAIGDSVPTSLATAEDVFVHRADCLDLTTLNKLVQRIPSTARVHLVVSGIMTHVSDESLALSSLRLSDRLRRDRLRTLISPPPSTQAEYKSTHTPKIRSGRSSNSRIAYDIVSGTLELSERVLFHYRKAVEEGTAIIIVPTPAECAHFNNLLHSEAVADRTYLGESTAVVRLASNMMACAGEPVAWLHTDLRFNCLQGMHAQIDTILPGQHPADKGFDCVIVKLDDDSRVTLSKVQSQHLALAYAVPLQGAILGAWDTVIVACHPGKSASPDWVESCARLATSQTICISHPNSTTSRFDEGINAGAHHETKR